MGQSPEGAEKKMSEPLRLRLKAIMTLKWLMLSLFWTVLAWKQPQEVVDPSAFSGEPWCSMWPRGRESSRRGARVDASDAMGTCICTNSGHSEADTFAAWCETSAAVALR